MIRIGFVLRGRATLKRLFLVFTWWLLLASGVSAQQLNQAKPLTTSTHGLKLIINQDSAHKKKDGTSQPPHAKGCSERNATIACLPLTIILKNEGEETILRWGSTCPGGILDASFELQGADGSWQSFTPGESFNCVSNVAFVQRIAPGESYEWRLKLADLNLPLDAGRSRAVRVRWDLMGCIAAQTDVPKVQDPFADQAHCFGDKEPQHRFVSLQSNEIRWEPSPAPVMAR